MKLLVMPLLPVRRAVQRTILSERTSVQLLNRPAATSKCHQRHPQSTLTRSRAHHPKTTQTDAESSLSHKIRLLMRQIPHPVAIVTACSSSALSSSTTSNSHSANVTPHTPRGMTVSSFNTVTLHPKPIVAFNVRQPSETLAALQSSGRFLIHLLAPKKPTATLARNFSRGNANVELDEFDFIESESPTSKDRSASSSDKNKSPTSTISLPRLIRRRSAGGSAEEVDRDEQDFTFILECKYLPEKSIQVYDHMIVLGLVQKVVSSSIATTAASTTQGRDEKVHGNDDFCLMYADTRFWKIGEET